MVRGMRRREVVGCDVPFCCWSFSPLQRVEALVLFCDRVWGSSTSRCSGLHDIGADGALLLEPAGMGVHAVDQDVPKEYGANCVCSVFALLFFRTVYWLWWTVGTRLVSGEACRTCPLHRFIVAGD